MGAADRTGRHYDEDATEAPDEGPAASKRATTLTDLGKEGDPRVTSAVLRRSLPAAHFSFVRHRSARRTAAGRRGDEPGRSASNRILVPGS